MNTIRTRHYSKELPYIISVKPYFFTNHSRTKSLQTPANSKRDSLKKKKYPIESLDFSHNTSQITSKIFEKLGSRPSSPVTVHNKSIHYISSSTQRKKYYEASKNFEIKYSQLEKLSKIVDLSQGKKNKEKLINSSQTTKKISMFTNYQRKAIKLDNNHTLVDCASNASFDYFMPRYKN